MDAQAVVAVVIAYLLGSVDFGVIVPRLRGVDIYAYGSGNPGAANVMRSLGKRAAAVVVLGDLAKGVVGAMVGDLMGSEIVGFAAAFAAVVGHCFPVWHRFRGGRGVATSVGAILWLEPVLGASYLALWGLVLALGRRASVASLTLAAAFVPGLALFGHRGWSLAIAGAIAALVTARHWDNIRRLIRGDELTIEERPLPKNA